MPRRACSCNDFSRTELMRRAAAEAGRGLPSIEPGMPVPAGTGLSRRSFLARSAGLALSVYGAGRLSARVFDEGIATLPVDDVLAVFGDVPSTELSGETCAGNGIGVIDLVARVQLAPSKAEARRLVQAGGVYVNNRRVTDVQARLTRDQAIGGRLFVLRKGQRETHLVRLT